MKTCSALSIKQTFTSWNNPKGNADTERVMLTIKENPVWPCEWDFPFEMNLPAYGWGIPAELESALKPWMQNCNQDYPHSSLGYLTPE